MEDWKMGKSLQLDQPSVLHAINIWGRVTRVTVEYFIISKIHSFVGFLFDGRVLVWRVSVCVGGRCELYYVEYHIDCLAPPTTLAVSHVLSSTGCCCSVSHQKSVGHTQHPFPCPGQCSSSSHSPDVGFLQLPASPHFLSARAMTRLLISIFSPPFITATTAVTYQATASSEHF